MLAAAVHSGERPAPLHVRQHPAKWGVPDREAGRRQGGGLPAADSSAPTSSRPLPGTAKSPHRSRRSTLLVKIGYSLIGESADYAGIATKTGIADKHKLLKDEADEPLMRFSNAKHLKHRDCESDRLQHAAGSAVLSNPRLRQAEPGPGLPAGFNGAPSSEATSPENSAQLGIEEFYNDPLLTRLIQQALVGNRELKILDQEVQIAKNEILARQGAYLPFLTVGAGAGLDKPSLYTLDGSR